VNGAHLARRFFGSLSRRRPDAAAVAWAHGFLIPAEAALWDRMAVQDRRHSIEVARRFVRLRPDADRAEMAAALLHDVGKLDAALGTLGRVAATLFGPRTERWRTYHDHEARGAAMLAAIGSDVTTIGLLQRRGAAAAALAEADDV